MTSASVHVDNVCKSYGRKAVLKHLNLSLWPGEIYGMLGSNGSGKSTLLRIIAGALRASCGSVTVAGATGYVAQKFSPYEDLSVEENVAFSARCYGLYARELHAGVNETLERFDLQRMRDFGEVIEPVNALRVAILQQEHRAQRVFRPREQEQMIGAEVEHSKKGGDGKIPAPSAAPLRG